MKTQAKNFIAAALFCMLLCMLLACLALLGVSRTASRAEEGDGAKLVLPSSYEEYLPLADPKDAAFSEDHIAVADGVVLYVYDRAEKTYTSVSLDEGNTVAKLGFAGERLFVATAGVSNSFYEYSFTEKQLKSFSFNCSTFLVEGGTLYTATVSNTTTTIASYKISALQNGTSAQAETLGTLETNATPSLAYSGGNLYCTVGGQVYYPDSTGKFGSGCFYLSSDDPNLVSGVKSVCAYGGRLLYTAQGGLYASDLLTHKSSLLLAGEGFGALVSYGDTLYAVCGTSVRAISVSGDTAAFTGYEIASASSSLNRLRGAVDTARAGDLLVTADAGNGRVSVLDLKTGTYREVLPPEGAEDLSFRYVATDGNLIAAATEKTVFTCAYTDGETMRFTAVETAGESSVRGIACVYGSVYYVTGNAYGKAGGDAVFHDAYGSPAALASDVYGDLFVAYDNRDVVRFAEYEFLTEDGGEKLNFTLPEGYASLRSDFDGNLYCLSGDKLLKNGEPILSVEAASSLVYGGTGLPCAFALGYEDSKIYLLYGDYIVKTAAEGIPTLDAIDAGGVFGDIFKAHEREGLVLDIPQNAIGVRVDLEEMKESDPETFPYLAYYRTEKEMRGVLLATKDGYALVVLYEVETASRTFTAALFRLETVAPVPAEEYFHEEAGARYLSSAVSSYYYPCLHPALAGERLERGTRLDVLGTVSMPERDYALVGYEGGFGYVPAAYLTDVRPIPEDTGVYEPAWLKESKEGVKFTAEDGEELVVYERTRVDLTKHEDGTYTARLTKDGKVYRADVSEKMIDRGESDALRISLIVILSVLAVGICGCYAWYYPRKKPLDEMPKNK